MIYLHPDERKALKMTQRLLPVMLDSAEPPLGFGRIHAADLRSWQGGAEEQVFLDLKTSIRRILGADAPRPELKSEQNGSVRPRWSFASRIPGCRRWLLASAMTLLVVLLALWYAGRSDGQVWFLVHSVQVEGRLASAPVKVTIWTNGLEYHYPSLGGAEWMEVGPGMSPFRFKIPSAKTYEVRFEMAVKSGRGEQRFISQDTDVIRDFPHEGRYDLHELAEGVRGISTSAIISYQVQRNG